MRQVDGVGRLVPRDLVARPAGVSGCHPRTRTGSASSRAQVTELVPPVPKTKGIIAWSGEGRISLADFLDGTHFPLPRERARVRGKSRKEQEDSPSSALCAPSPKGEGKGCTVWDKRRVASSTGRQTKARQSAHDPRRTGCSMIASSASAKTSPICGPCSG